MANSNLGQLGEILKGLTRLAGQGAQVAGKTISENSPIAIISQLIGQVSAIPEQQDLAKATEGVGQQSAEQKPELSFAEKLSESTEKAVLKQNVDKVEEAAASGMSALQILEKQAEINNIPSPGKSLQQQISNPQAQRQQPRNFDFLDLLSFAVPGLIGIRGAIDKSRGVNRQTKLGGREKLQIQHDNRIREIQETARLKGTDVTDEQAIAATAADSLRSLVALRSKIALKGPLLNPLGATLGVFGIGSEQRAEFESGVEQFVFDIGAIIGQTGRAFTEKEQKLVRNGIIAASLSAKESVFRGKSKAVAARINRLAGKKIVQDNFLDVSSRQGTVTTTFSEGLAAEKKRRGL